jgi:hypothetical protein
MKNNFQIIVILLVLFGSGLGCGKDNFDPPESTLSGRVVYQSQPIGVRSDGVQLELWQRGFQLFSKIPVYVAQDGTFSVSLFDGDYLLTRLKGNGPWADNTDTILVSVRGNTTVDVPVDPYFIIKSETFTKSGNDINVSFNLQRVNTSRNLEAVRLYIGQTLLTDQNRNEANVQKAASAITDLSQPVTLTATIPASLLTKQNYVFARVGVKTVGVAELAYSMPQKIALK